ncbi:MAG: hypothetical protein KDD02_05945 [Phaeodactylibacter sp.]|nr:hypothetical protein [Phaeodactylibacter sp.]MCB9301322.1 hypothetical protein [Lewinellaceae bacterium]
MKTFRLSFLLMLCLLAGSATFANNPILDNKGELRKAVAKMIQAPELSKFGITETQAFVHFTLNEDNEIIVLEVVADNEYIREYITESLDHRKVNAPGVEAFTEYNIKVSFRTEKAVTL